WLSVKVTPPGSAPDSLKLGVGNPVVVIVNVPAAPYVNSLVVWFALVIAGRAPTLTVGSVPARGRADVEPSSENAVVIQTFCSRALLMVLVAVAVNWMEIVPSGATPSVGVFCVKRR